ncbi:hypothetical protein MWU59_11150 [Flavobacteriaceae bacterium F08102]|nr:hypothetical protein [Flavobacteriaceae bacterium F08102]
MNLFKKIFNQNPTEEKNAASTTQPSVALDETFVQNFIDKGGKFLYCTSHREVEEYLANILNEHQWKEVLCLDEDLQSTLTSIGARYTLANKSDYPFFTFCEHLIAEEGSIMFSSEQVFTKKIAELPEYFIVMARTSQLVRNKAESLMGIRQNYHKNFPTNISSIKSYRPEKVSDDFLSYGNNNAKNLYLLLLEDL